jgi:hypothetical protein
VPAVRGLSSIGHLLPNRHPSPYNPTLSGILQVGVR